MREGGREKKKDLIIVRTEGDVSKEKEHRPILEDVWKRGGGRGHLLLSRVTRGGTTNSATVEL